MPDIRPEHRTAAIKRLLEGDKNWGDTLLQGRAQAAGGGHEELMTGMQRAGVNIPTPDLGIEDEVPGLPSEGGEPEIPQNVLSVIAEGYKKVIDSFNKMLGNLVAGMKQ